jgi:RNA polymerase sigma-70 factor (ECF subfamily)
LRTLGDVELAALATAGEREAFSELLRRHAPRLRALLRRMGAAPVLADDIAQDACLKAFERIGTFRGEGAFGAWLNQIGARLYIRRWRRESRIDWVAELPEDVPGDLAPVGLALDAMDLDKALQGLTPAERMCISLCVGAGLTHHEAAAELRLPLGTVKSHVHRGLVKLRAQFETTLAQAKGAARVRA